MEQEQIKDFTRGPILGPPLAFSMPILLALFLQALYGTVDRPWRPLLEAGADHRLFHILCPYPQKKELMRHAETTP